MAWYLFIQRDNGDLVSEGSSVPAHLVGCMEDAEDPLCLFSVRELPERPDWTVRVWDRLTRALVDRPLPVLIDRLEDIHARLLTDADFMLVWNGLNATRRQQLRQGLGRILAALMGARRFRQEDEQVELD